MTIEKIFLVCLQHTLTYYVFLKAGYHKKNLVTTNLDIPGYNIEHTPNVP